MPERHLLPARIDRSYSLKFALALLAVVGIVVASGAAIHVQTTDQLRSDVRADLTETTALRAEQLDTWLASVSEQARMVSQHPTVTGGDPAEIKPYFTDLVTQDRVAEGVVAVHYLNGEEMRIVTSSSDKMIGVSPATQGAAFAENPPKFSGPDDVAITKPFTIEAVDFPVVAVISPVPTQPHRVVVFMINLERRMAAFSNAVAGEEMFVVNDRGQYIAHPESEKLLTTREGGSDAELVRRGSEGANGFVEIDGGDTLAAFAALETTDWIVVREVPTSTAFALGDLVLRNILILTVLTVLSLAAIGVTLGRNTIRALMDLEEKADTMADGDLDVDLSTDRRDEIGSLFDSFADMRDSLVAKIDEADEARAEAEAARERAEQINHHLESKAEHYSEVMQACAEGDLTKRVDPDSRNDAMADIGTAFNRMVAELEETVTEIQRFADRVAESSEDVTVSTAEVEQASEQVSESVQEISAGADKQRDRLEEVSGEMQHLSGAIEEVAASTDQVAMTADQAADLGETSQEAASAAIDEMAGIEETTKATVAEVEGLAGEIEAVSEIVDLIAEIAEQTNLLALNASIEAARAGEAGEGFAVVADEVKSLAEEAGEATEQIEAHIEDIQRATDEAVEDMREMGDRVDSGAETIEEALDGLEDLAVQVDEINTGIQEINEATDDQATSTEEVVRMIDEVTGVAERTSEEATTVSAAAEEQTASLSEVTTSTQSLVAQSESLQDRLEAFTISGETAAAEHPAEGLATPDGGSPSHEDGQE